MNEAAKRLSDTLAQIDALPDEIKPSIEEILEELHTYYAEKSKKLMQSLNSNQTEIRTGDPAESHDS